MTIDLLPLLRCPVDGSPLSLRDASEENGSIKDGWLVSATEQHKYRISNFIPRFVDPVNYAGNFGLQWNRFKRTQLDSFSGQPISRDRFFRFSGWEPQELKSKSVLDVGCGAGRFTEVVLNCGAQVVAVDYSTAVDACRDNLGAHPNLELVQADIYHLPFSPRRFEFVYCFGVLQHTPNVKDALLNLPDQLRPGGRLAVDLYPRLLVNWLWPKYWLRPITKRLSPLVLFRLIEAMIDYLLPVSDCLARVPQIGRWLKYLIPVANYKGILPLTPLQRREWALLDTWDMLSPRYDQPQSRATLLAWLKQAGLYEIDVFRSGFLVGRGRSPAGTEETKTLSRHGSVMGESKRECK